MIFHPSPLATVLAGVLFAGTGLPAAAPVPTGKGPAVGTPPGPGAPVASGGRNDDSEPA